MLFITTIFVSGVLQYLGKTRLYNGAPRSLHRDRLLYQSASSFEDVSATDGLQMLLMHIRERILIDFVDQTTSRLPQTWPNIVILCNGLMESFTK